MHDNPPNVSLKEDKSKTTSVSSSRKDSSESFVEDFRRSVVPNFRPIARNIDDILAERHSPYLSALKDLHLPFLSTSNLLESLKENTRRLSVLQNSKMAYRPEPLPLAQESSRPEKNIFVSQLIQSFDKELLEDGYFHPSQKIIAQGLISYHDSVSQWLFEIYDDNLKVNPSLSASLLKSIGRCDFAEVYPWGFMMASLGILENSVEIRGAAVDCFENWGDERSLEKLKAHVNQEQVPWLRDYISQVINTFANLSERVDNTLTVNSFLNEAWSGC